MTAPFVQPGLTQTLIAQVATPMVDSLSSHVSHAATSWLTPTQGLTLSPSSLDLYMPLYPSHSLFSGLDGLDFFPHAPVNIQDRNSPSSTSPASFDDIATEVMEYVVDESIDAISNIDFCSLSTGVIVTLGALYGPKMVKGTLSMIGSALDFVRRKTIYAVGGVPKDQITTTPAPLDDRSTPTGPSVGINLDHALSDADRQGPQTIDGTVSAAPSSQLSELELDDSEPLTQGNPTPDRTKVAPSNGVNPNHLIPEGLPQKIGKYEYRGPIKKGGQGHVFLYESDPDEEIDGTSELVAVKFLDPSQLPSERSGEENPAITQFRKEIQKMKRMNNSDHMARIIGQGRVKESGWVYMIQELLPGADLHEVSAYNIPLKHALRFVVDIAQGIDDLHKSKLIHKDLKPGNIMITPKPEFAHLYDAPRDPGEAKSYWTAVWQRATVENLWDHFCAKIIDLGLTSSVNSTTADKIAGTLTYMSPEQMMVHPLAGLKPVKPTTQTDIFAVGLILYRILTGHSAIKKPDHFLELMRRMADELIESRKPENRFGYVPYYLERGPSHGGPSYLERATSDPAIQKLLVRASHPDTQSRYKTPQQLIRALERLLAESD